MLIVIVRMGDKVSKDLLVLCLRVPSGQCATDSDLADDDGNHYRMDSDDWKDHGNPKTVGVVGYTKRRKTEMRHSTESQTLPG